ncbi:MAG: hypothetical protein ACYDFU_07465 [Nitrospirota bacterium]
MAKILEKIKSEPELLQRSLPTIVLLVWCYYSHDDKNVPGYEYVKTFRFKLGIPEEDENSEKEKNWDFILRHYEYAQTDEFDLALATVIETGFVNEGLLLKEAKKINEKIIAEKSHSSFVDAWKLYHNSFAENEKELVNAFYKSVRENVKYISARDLESTISLIRKFGNNSLASELINFYIDANKDRPGTFDLDSHFPGWEINDTEIRSKFNRITNEIKKVKTLEDVVKKISEKNGWSSSDEEILSSATEDEYYELFKRQEGEHLSAYVEACLLFDRVGNATEKQKKITENTKNALTRIGRESELNKMRVGRFGIKI